MDYAVAASTAAELPLTFTSTVGTVRSVISFSNPSSRFQSIFVPTACFIPKFTHAAQAFIIRIACVRSLGNSEDSLRSLAPFCFDRLNGNGPAFVVVGKGYLEVAVVRHPPDIDIHGMLFALKVLTGAERARFSLLRVEPTVPWIRKWSALHRCRFLERGYRTSVPPSIPDV